MTVGLMLADDYLFISRVQGFAKAAGASVKAVRHPETLIDLARTLSPGGVLLDLHIDGLDIGPMVEGLHRLDPRPFVVGYGSHVDVATLKKARDAGCDLVLPRSKFVEDLPTKIGEWLRGADEES
jgi:DNA-binding NarL/FixJ family response regulator